MPATDACLPNASYRNEPTATLAPHLQVAEAMAIASPPCSPPPTGRKSISWPILGALLRAAACSTIRLPPHLGHTGRSYKPVILADQGRPQPSSIWAAVGACEGPEGGGRTVEHRDTVRPNLPAGSWAFTTIHHTLLSSALPPCPTSTDRGEGRARTRESPGVCEPLAGRLAPAGVA